jgi:NADPH:quinone reductase-like Zn-dependent oxidoreductase
MKAAVLHEFGAVPEFGDAREPAPEPGQVVVEVAAAALHHLDIHKATGTFYMGPPPLPCAVGTDGVGRLADGRRVYFDETVAPHGSMAERALVREDALFDVPDGVDDAVAAALGNSALAAWLAPGWRGGLREGETVLVLGATGAVGTLAVQAARMQGAGRVVAAGRDGPRLRRLLDLGADAVIDLASTDDLPAAIREAAGGPVDLTVDMLWGAPAAAALQTIARFGRHVQVGQLAGTVLELPAPAIRSASIDVRGFSVAHPPREVLGEAHRRLLEHVARGDITVDVDALPLSEVARAWEHQRSGAGGPKLVLLPRA